MTYFQFTINRSGLRFFTVFFLFILISRRLFFLLFPVVVVVVVVVAFRTFVCGCNTVTANKINHSRPIASAFMQNAPNALCCVYTKHIVVYIIHSIFCNCTWNLSKQFPFPSFDPIKCLLKWLAHSQMAAQPQLYNAFHWLIALIIFINQSFHLLPEVTYALYC